MAIIGATFIKWIKKIGIYEDTEKQTQREIRTS
jgi:hypothetical protein